MAEPLDLRAIEERVEKARPVVGFWGETNEFYRYAIRDARALIAVVREMRGAIRHRIDECEDCLPWSFCGPCRALSGSLALVKGNL